MKIISKEEIIANTDLAHMFALQKEAFIKYSEGKVDTPPIGHLSLENGSLHIKHGYVKGDSIFVAKLATGFSSNAKLGLPTVDGCFVVFDAKTGAIKSILVDEGYLTNLRTVLAGALAVQVLNDKIPKCVGIIGTGLIAKEQARILHEVLGIKEFFFLGRNEKALESLNFSEGMKIERAVIGSRSMEEMVSRCKTIVTCTNASSFVLPDSEQIKDHVIVAIGCDEHGKQEIDPQILARADLLVCDARKQSLNYGEFQYLKEKREVFELGELLKSKEKAKKGTLRICDLTGMAAQDIFAVKGFL